MIGAILALLVAFILKKRSESRLQTLLIIITPWIGYLLAEGLELSGIVSILCTGVFLHIYAAPNIPKDTRKALHTGVETAVYTCETLVFLFLGLGVFAFKHPTTRSFWMILITIPILNIA
jgi:NhaP-type Na+/H+ or K+/H+ antiporter